MLTVFLLRLSSILPLLLLLLPLCTTKPYAAGPPDSALIDPAEKNASFWKNQAQQFLLSRIERFGEDEDGVANNVIMFYGDGMGPSTLTAARWYKGQVTGTPRPQLAWEAWPGMSLARVFCVDSMVADSGCSATAYSSGVKGNFFSMGVSGSVKNCQQQVQEAANQDVTSILQWAMEEGRSTGIVTTTDITDASPSAFYAHIASRYWKNDYLVPVEGCPDIAMQMIRSHPGRDINVLLGRGSKNFIPSSQGGFRKKDDLIQEWTTRRSQGSQMDNYVFINKSVEVEKVDTKKTDFLLGLFEKKDKPDLTAMTKTAIEILSKNPKGFFLFVENEEIDNTNHDNLAGGTLEEVLNLEEAVNTALNMTANNNDNMNENNTLILVSADHAHTLTISGYPQRGQDILGTIWKDGPTILNYASGPGALSPSDPSANVSAFSRVYPSLHAASNSWHGGDDVAVYARGPGSKMFWGNVDQTVIPHLLAYSACIGPGRRNAHCGRKVHRNGNALLSLDTSVDTSLISQCSGPEKSNCRAVHVNQEVLDGLGDSDTLSLLPSCPIVLTLRQTPTQNSGSRSFSFRVGQWGEATITVGDNGAMYGSIKPDDGSVNYTIESCGNGCNVIYEIDPNFFNQFRD